MSSQRRSGDLIAIAVGVLILFGSIEARSAVLFETASIGPSVTSIFFQPVLGDQILGTRFEVTEAVTVTHIGAHVLSDGVPGRLTYASLVALSGPSDMPDSVDRTTPDFLATTTLFPTNPSSDVEGEITPQLISPGWYGLVYGEWQGGHATFMVRGNTPLGSPTFFSGSVSGGPHYEPWLVENNVRMYARGIPEPTSVTALALAALALRRAERRITVQSST